MRTGETFGADAHCEQGDWVSPVVVGFVFSPQRVVVQAGGLASVQCSAPGRVAAVWNHSAP